MKETIAKVVKGRLQALLELDRWTFLQEFDTNFAPLALLCRGGMIFAVTEEIIAESQSSGHGDVATFGVMLGLR